MSPPTKNNLKNSGGQSVIELCITAPALLALFVALLSVLALGWIQLEVSSLTQEFGVCLLQKSQSHYCRSAYQNSLAQLPGSFKVASFAMSARHIQVQLKHRLPLLNPEWKFYEPVPQFSSL